MTFKLFGNRALNVLILTVFGLVCGDIATSAIVIAQKPAEQASCGPEKVNFDVQLDKTKHSALPIEPGKARIYFVQDIGMSNPLGMRGALMTKIGIDGTWVGANKTDSWFSVSVEPGEHHLCVNASSHIVGPVVEFAHFTAEAGQVYYYRTWNFMWYAQHVEFGPTDSDQALYMISKYPLAVSKFNK